MTAPDLSAFLLARLAEDEAAANVCAEMFPPPWEVADRGWRVRIYADDTPTPDLSTDDEDAMTTRTPVVMEVEPDRHIEDPRWLSERVEHVARHDPARVLREVEAKRAIVEACRPVYPVFYRESARRLCEERGEVSFTVDAHGGPMWPHAGAEITLRCLASVYRDHPEFDAAWLP